MRFHFAITGDGQGGNEVQFVEWLQKMVTEYNMRHTNTNGRFTRFHVLVREDVIQDDY